MNLISLKPGNDLLAREFWLRPSSRPLSLHAPGEVTRDLHTACQKRFLCEVLIFLVSGGCSEALAMPFFLVYKSFQVLQVVSCLTAARSRLRKKEIT